MRVVLRNNEPWFVAKDICDALDYKNSRKAVADHLDDDERCNQQLHRGYKPTIINESGLYALVLRSRKPEARKFAKWVTSEDDAVLFSRSRLPRILANNPELFPTASILQIASACIERLAQDNADAQELAQLRGRKSTALVV